MLYLFSTDKYHFEDEQIKKIIKHQSIDIEELRIVVTKEDLILAIKDYYNYIDDGKYRLLDSSNDNKNINNNSKLETLMPDISKKNIKKFAILSSFMPHQLDPSFKGEMFTVKVLKNKYGLLTKEEYDRGVKEEDILKEKLGSTIHLPKIKLKDYGGAEKLNDIVNTIPLKESLGIKARGFFLAGMPGTGKSFFAKAVAGELNRILIELNLSKFMQQSNTFELIEAFFEFFENNTGDYIIWIDEIEKSLNTEDALQVLGFLLTRINEMQTKSLSNVFLIATANNLEVLSVRNPELFRNGRFDWLIALNPPLENGAREIINIYIKANKKTYREHIRRLIYTFIHNPEQLKNTISKGQTPENSAYFKLSNLIINEFSESLSVKESLQNRGNIYNFDSFETHFEALKKENYPLQLIYNRAVESFDFNPDIEKIITCVFAEYRENSVLKTNFPYVPAEIEFLIQQLYFTFLFTDTTLDPHYKKLILDVKPLQVSMKKGIEEMVSITSDFLKIE